MITPVASKFHSVSFPDSKTNTFTVPQQYTNLEFVEEDEHGPVVSADDSITGKRVAIKKLNHSLKSSVAAVKAYKEIMLRSSVKHSNIVKIFSAFAPQESNRNFQDIYLVMELMKHNLSEIIERVKLDHKTLSYFIYQILCGVNHLHRQRIIHGNLTPSNIAVNAKCEVKLLDFGVARKADSLESEDISPYYYTRAHSAPEIAMGLPVSEKVDVWSIGCIFAEMITGYMLFPGDDRIRRWNKIVEIMGTPSERFIDQLDERLARSMRKIPQTPPKSLEDIIPDHHFHSNSKDVHEHWTASNARRLISKMIAIDPNERCTIAQALRDPYVNNWYREDEVTAPLSQIKNDGNFDEADNTLSQWKNLIFNELKRSEGGQDFTTRDFKSTSTLLKSCSISEDEEMKDLSPIIEAKEYTELGGCDADMPSPFVTSSTSPFKQPFLRNKNEKKK